MYTAWHAYMAISAETTNCLNTVAEYGIHFELPQGSANLSGT